MSSLSRGFSTQDYIDSYTRTHFITDVDDHNREEEGEVSILGKVKQIIINTVFSSKKEK
jgi:hypothetical protein